MVYRFVIMVFMLLLSATPIAVAKDTSLPGFRAIAKQHKSAPLSLGGGAASDKARSIIAEFDEIYIELEASKLGVDLVWSSWLESVDRGLYPSLQPGLASESMLVYFEESPDGQMLHMFERVGRDRPVELIDRFPIVERVADRIVFDFSKGLKRRQLRFWIAPEEVNDLRIDYSYVYEFENHADVVSFAELLKLNDVNYSTMILHHAFRLDRANPNFHAVNLPEPAKDGFFPASFATSNAGNGVAIRKFDTTQPITWHISSATPAEYREALAEGMLWWNASLGREVIRVEILEEPVSWANARINILHWSANPDFCGDAIAIGVSEANPRTGEVYGGKIVLCGEKLFPLYALGVDPAAYGEDEFRQRAFAWVAAHELGHVLGFAHNFHGKVYRNDENSTVMDYPYPEEIMRFAGVGAGDDAKIDFLYKQPGSPSALEQLRSIPFCSDDETLTVPDCNRFARGGSDQSMNVYRYLGLIEAESSLPVFEHNVRQQILKSLFAEGTDLAENSFRRLLQSYPGSQRVLMTELADFGTHGRSQFLSLPEEQKSSVYELLFATVLCSEIALGFENQVVLIDFLASDKSYPVFEHVSALEVQIQQRIDGTSDRNELTDLYRLHAHVKQTRELFWQE